MKGIIIKTKQVLAMALAVGVFIGYVGLANADVSGTKLTTPDQATKAKISENYGKLPLSFIQNDGQMDKKVKYYERGNGHSTYFTSDGVYLELLSNSEAIVESKNIDNDKQTIAEHQSPTSRNQNIKSEMITLVPLGANKSPEITAEGKQQGRVNYYRGSDSEDWQTDIPTYNAIIYEDIYNGIDMKFYGNNRKMEYDIIVEPGKDPSVVRLSYEGIEDLSITKDGALLISLKQGKVIQNKPYCYQEIDGKKIEVEGSFKLLNSQAHNTELPTLNSELLTQNSQLYAYAFEVVSYDSDYPLIIDPTLVYSTYLGGSSYEIAHDIEIDSSGNAYITGFTNSSATELSTTEPCPDRPWWCQL